MARFTPLEAAAGEGLREAETWLRECLERERAARGLAPELVWSLEAGRREAGPPRGPRLAQLGFQIQLGDVAGRAWRSLACFIAADDVEDEEQRLVVEQIVSLWLDRVLEEL